MRSIPVLATLMFAAACNLGELSGRDATPYTTVIDTIGDTVVARTAGDVPDSHLRQLTLVWTSASDPNDSTMSLGDVSGMAVGPDGRVFVWDHATPTIWMYDANGKLLRRVGRPGAGPGEYDRLNGMAVRPDGKLVVWDAGNARFNVYDADGMTLTSWKLSFGGRFTSNALIADNQNRIWMRSSVRDPNDPLALSQPAVFRYDTAGAMIDTVLIPRYTTDDAPLVARRQEGENRSTSSMTVPYGTYSTYAMSPLGYVVSGPGRPYVVNAVNGGKPLRIERDATPVPVSAEERSQRRAQTEFNLRRTQPDWSWSGPDVAATKPPYAAFTIGLDGRIWVSLSAASEAFEPDPPPASQTNPPPPVKFRPKERRWDVYEPDGRYLGRVVGSRLFQPYAMRGNEVWGVLRDEDDVPSIVKMRADLGG